MWMNVLWALLAIGGAVGGYQAFARAVEAKRLRVSLFYCVVMLGLALMASLCALILLLQIP